MVPNSGSKVLGTCAHLSDAVLAQMIGAALKAELATHSENVMTVILQATEHPGLAFAHDLAAVENVLETALAHIRALRSV